MISTTKLSELADAPLRRLQKWAECGLTPDVVGTVGRRHGHQYSLMRAVGLCVAAALQRTPQSATVRYMAALTAAFAAMAEQDLLAEFAGGRTHFIGLDGCRPVLGEAAPGLERVDVRAVYDQVKAAAAEGK